VAQPSHGRQRSKVRHFADQPPSFTANRFEKLVTKEELKPVGVAFSRVLLLVLVTRSAVGFLLFSALARRHGDGYIRGSGRSTIICMLLGWMSPSV
jgi:hypothetical protein